jgi:membrane-associated phospholipid phosphatase
MTFEDRESTMNNWQRRTDNLMAAYLLITAGLVLAFRQTIPQWEIVASIHLLAAALVGTLRFVPAKLPRAIQFLRDWYPVIVFPLFYKEVEVFAAAFGNWGLTEPIRQLEVALFGGHPSIYLSERLPWVPLSEYLHFCYLSHVLLIPVVGGYWYHNRREAFRELLFLFSLTLLSSFLFFILFPVDSPFYLAEPLGAPFAGHFFYDLVHFVSGHGGARGGAFPSSHVSVSLVIWLVAWQRQRRVAYLLTPIVAGLIVATVYGRFHYVLDVIAGGLWAVAVVGVYRLSRAPGREESLVAESS